MCGIVGVVSKVICDEVKANVDSLIYQSRIRGIHSFGVAYYKGDELVCKKTHNITDLSYTLHPLMIFHNRYSTSGDWREHKNNQPICLNNSAVAFNGVISMKDKGGMESEYGVFLESDNDAELALIRFGKLEELTNGKSFAGLFLIGGKMYHFRNKMRPCYFYEDDKAIYIASTKDIFKRAMGVQAIETNPNKLWKIS